MPITVNVNGFGEINFPDDISEQEIQSVLSSQYDQKPERLGFKERLDKDFQERVGKLDKVEGLVKQGKISPATAGGAILGQGAAVLGNIPTQMGVSAFYGVDDLTGNKISGLAGKAGQAIAGSGFGKAAGNVIGQAVQGYDKFAENNPAIATNLGTIGNLATSLPSLGVTAKGTQMAAKGVAPLAGAVADNVADAAKGTIKAATTKKIYPTLDKIKNVSQKYYAKADELGVEVNPAVISESVRSFVKELPQDVYGKRTAGKSTMEMMDFIDNVLPQEGEILSFSSINNLDKELTRRAFSSTVSDPSLSRFYKGIQSELRSIIDNGGDDVMNAQTQEAAQYAKEARRLWSSQSKIRDIESILENSESADVPATAIKNGFKNLKKDKKRYNSYPIEAKLAIDKAAKTGKTEGLLKVMGSRLNAISGGAAGGFGGAAGGFAISEIGRAGSGAIKRGQGNNVGNLIKEGTGLVREVPRFTTKEGLKKALRERK